MMKKCCALLLCLMLVLFLTACQPPKIEHLNDDSPALINMPNSVPGEPDGVPENQING